MMEIQYPQGLCPVLPCPAHQAWHCQFSKDLSIGELLEQNTLTPGLSLTIC